MSAILDPVRVKNMADKCVHVQNTTLSGLKYIFLSLLLVFSFVQVIHEPPPPVVDDVSVRGLFCLYLIATIFVALFFISLQHTCSSSIVSSFENLNSVSLLFRMMKKVFPRRGGPQWMPHTTEDVESEASREWR